MIILKEGKGGLSAGLTGPDEEIISFIGDNTTLIGSKARSHRTGIDSAVHTGRFAMVVAVGVLNGLINFMTDHARKFGNADVMALVKKLDVSRKDCIRAVEAWDKSD
jgi:hypothetical protein